jgi:hypothetical protein
MPKIRLAVVALVAAAPVVGSLVVTPRAHAHTSDYHNQINVVLSGTGSGEVTDYQVQDAPCVGSDKTCAYYTLAIEFYAFPEEGSTFIGWTPGSCNPVATTGPCEVNTGRVPPLVVGAVFSRITEELTVARKGDGAGTVTSSPAGIICGATCRHSFNYGSTVALAADAEAGSSFSGWSLGCSGTAVCTLSMKAAQGVKATFLKDCLVPKLKGKSLRKAKSALLAHDCSLGTIKRVSSATVTRDHVISQKPSPGRQRGHAASVNLVISKGKP